MILEGYFDGNGQVYLWFVQISRPLQVTTPLLKFMCEFVLNKAQRLTFDSSSPNGILLFREVSKAGLWVKGSGFRTIAALCGNYVNFGVFELYGDRALADALDISLKMSLSVPLSDILAFKKRLLVHQELD
ncbi:hypothetical protein OsI_12617 [Oryza sativa Indica Group]|uniref:Uncharacterized protein n=1 Tax=Oryza sativa subsp. indica TaxID=39946 RepID=B8AMJ4_ORYSI|nr:hypothetical protein OsI_12617 [Oryza sativa Indica Group]